jgi:hypothetical protein
MAGLVGAAVESDARHDGCTVGLFIVIPQTTSITLNGVFSIRNILVDFTVRPFRTASIPFRVSRRPGATFERPLLFNKGIHGRLAFQTRLL